MSAPRVKSIACASPGGLHRMAYYDWGDPDNPDIVLCVHGLTRTGRDFDVLAERLSKRFRVICPDVVGRGLSDWLSQPLSYTVPQYAADMVSLIARLQPKSLRWVGTSMGGADRADVCGARGTGQSHWQRFAACQTDRHNRGGHRADRSPGTQ